MKKEILEICKKIYSRFIPVKKNRVIFWDGTPNSGSNVRILYEYFCENHSEYESIYFTRNQYISNLFKYITLVSSARVIVTSHGCSKLKNSQTYIECWHGIPLKKMGLLLGLEEIAFADKYVSSSETYTTLLNACAGSNKEYVITGFPRNDYFFRKSKKVMELFKELGLKEENKKIVLMPTFRKGLGRVETEIQRGKNVLGFDDISMEEINTLLKENNIDLLVKLHPAEEADYLDKIKNLSNITLITSKYLNDKEIDIYEVLERADTLITDYSSVYFDYLLANKPIIFLTNDVNEYESNRGFLLEPVKFWQPGYRVDNYKEFSLAIKDIVEEKDLYKDNRKEIKDILHRYCDGKSSNRLSDRIVSILSE